jgi:hypothetical protein
LTVKKGLRLIFDLGVGFDFSLLKLTVAPLAALFGIKQLARTNSAVWQFAQRAFVVNSLLFPLRENGLPDFVNADKAVFVQLLRRQWQIVDFLI